MARRPTSPWGVIFLIVARALSAERDVILKERRERRKAAKGKAKREMRPPRWQQVLSRGTPRTTFAVGALLTLPGASYLVALTRLAKDDLGAPETVLAVVGFNLIDALPCLSCRSSPIGCSRTQRQGGWNASRPGCAGTVGGWRSG